MRIVVAAALVFGLVGCEDVGVISHANTRAAVGWLQMIDLAVTQEDGAMAAFWTAGLPGYIQSILTPDGMNTNRRAVLTGFLMLPSDAPQRDVRICTATMCSFDYCLSKSDTTLQMQGSIKRVGDNLVFDVEQSYAQGPSLGQSGTLRGTILFHDGAVFGPLTVEANEHSEGKFVGSAEYNATVEFNGVALDDKNCLSGGSLSASSRYEARGDWEESFDLTKKVDIDPSCP